MVQLPYSNNRTKAPTKPAGKKIQKSVASELITALSKSKIKRDVDEQMFEDGQVVVDVKSKIDPKDFQATIAKNLTESVKKLVTVMSI